MMGATATVKALLRVHMLTALALTGVGCSACGRAEALPEPNLSASTVERAVPMAPTLVLKGRGTPPEPAMELRPAPVAPTPATAVAPNPVAGPQASPRYAGADITSSLEGAMVEIAGAEEGPRLSQVVKRVLVWWMDLRRDLRKGDRIEVVYETSQGGEEPVAHALWLTASKLGGTRSAVRFKISSSRFARWYETDGTEVESRLHPSPIADYEQVTSLLKDGRGHKGVDFKAPVGTAILAPFDGVVSRRNWSRRRNGNCLELVDTKKGINAYFLHLDSIPKHIQPGRRVKVGETVAISGNTGRSTAPHLHYQLERSGKVLDPFRVHETRQRRLSPEDQQAARAAWARYEQMRAGSK